MNLTAEDIYDKKHNIYEILSLLPNLPIDTIFNSSLDDRDWFMGNDMKSLVDDCKYPIESEFYLKDILDATYTIVKPKQEAQTWVEIRTNQELCNAVVNERKIKITNIADCKITTYLFTKENYDIELMARELKSIWAKLEYLEG